MSVPAEKLSEVPAGPVAEQKAHFEEHGYFVIRGAVSPARLEAMRLRLLQEFDRQQSEGKLFAGGGNLTGHLNCFPGEESRFAWEELSGAGIIDTVRALDPRAVRGPRVGMNFNLPGSVIQHFHADRPFTQWFMIVNVAVVDTDLVNGAIELVPGTHRKWYPYYKFALGNAPTVRVEMKQGDVLVRSSNLWHRGMPNHSKTPRPMMALTWEDGGSTLADSFSSDEGKITFKPNWFAPTWLGRLRERTFIAAPFTYNAYRFVTSLRGTKGLDH